MKKIVNITESELMEMVKNAVKVIREETERREEYYESPDGSEKEYRRTEVSVEDSSNDSESQDNGGSEPKNMKTEVDGYIGRNAEEIGMEVKDTNGSQLNQGGDPFSEKVRHAESGQKDDGEKKDSLDDIISEAIRKYRK